jgi:hypothetical protein
MSQPSTTVKMLAYHNDPQLKEQFLSLLRWHQEQDRIIKGKYADNPKNGLISVAGFSLPSKFKGCAIGCSINSLKAITGRTDIEYGDHAAYEELIGVPHILARLEDGIFERLPDEKSQAWPVRFAEAIPAGADLSLVWPRFAHWLLVDERDGVIRFAKTDDQRDAIRGVAELYQDTINGIEVSIDTWRNAADDAADAAYAATYAAYAAAYAAYAAAYAAADAAYAAADAADAAADAAYAAYDASYAAADAAADDAISRHYEKMADKLVDLLSSANS